MREQPAPTAWRANLRQPQPRGPKASWRGRPHLKHVEKQLRRNLLEPLVGGGVAAFGPASGLSYHRRKGDAVLHEHEGGCGIGSRSSARLNLHLVLLKEETLQSRLHPDEPLSEILVGDRGLGLQHLHVQSARRLVPLELNDLVHELVKAHASSFYGPVGQTVGRGPLLAEHRLLQLVQPIVQLIRLHPQAQEHLPQARLFPHNGPLLGADVAIFGAVDGVEGFLDGSPQFPERPGLGPRLSGFSNHRTQHADKHIQERH
mmetsp:Transcript_103289/g.296529  ORF Transcript_103289/g.296529 Transcript_103289/m.296529 type:complete len:260 (-) Transcript_103289:1122-1901(-)